MPDKNESGAGNSINRRKVLRSASAVGASMVFAGASSTAKAASTCHLPNQSDQDSKEDTEWQRSNSDYYVSSNTNPLNRLTEIQSGLAYRYSEYLQNEGEWIHFFRSFGAGYTLQETYPDGDFESTPSMSHQEIKISNNIEDSTSLYVSYNPDEVGAAPAPNHGNDLNYGQAAWTVAASALARTSTFAAVAIPAAQAFAALLDTGKSGSSGTPVTYHWPYEMDSAPCESVHFAKYHFIGKNGSTFCNFTVRQEIGQYSGLWVMNQYDVEVNAVPLPPLPHSTSSDSDIATADNHPKPGTSEYTDFLERTDAAKKIPFDDIENPRSRELANGGPVYRARNPSVKVTKSSGGGESAEDYTFQ